MSHRTIRFPIVEQLESRQLLASDWQNASLLCDVDHSTLVTPEDVLMLINNINSIGSRELPQRSPHATDPFYDVNGDSARRFDGHQFHQ
jgi:hypothetical protein